MQQMKQFRKLHWIHVTAQRKYVAIYCTTFFATDVVTWRIFFVVKKR